MKKAALFFGLFVSLAVAGVAQVRTVTNSTLQKFQEKRLAAERDYRDNYARLGFPSPEELDRQRESDMAARLQLADQLRQARLEKERLELESRSLNLQAAAMENEAEERRYYNESYGGYFGGFGGGFFSDGRFGNRRGNRRFFNEGYRATPFGIIPVPNPQPQRLFFRGGRRGGGGGIIRSGKR